MRSRCSVPGSAPRKPGTRSTRVRAGREPRSPNSAKYLRIAKPTPSWDTPIRSPGRSLGRCTTWPNPARERPQLGGMALRELWSTWRTTRSWLLASHRGIFRFWHKSAGCSCRGGAADDTGWNAEGSASAATRSQSNCLVLCRWSAPSPVVPRLGARAGAADASGSRPKDKGAASQRDLGEGNKGARREKSDPAAARQSTLPVRGRAAFRESGCE